ncbi:MAG: leucine-rich repeat domain-containing protein [Coriobacteriales bacterium]|jgi:hypothetical protein
MALSDPNIPLDKIESMNKAYSDHLDSIEKMKSDEKSRTSGEMPFEEEDGTVWKYVSIGDEFIRITGVETDRKSLVIPSSIDGLPVLSLATDSLARLDVEEVICPDEICQIQISAFRLCGNMRRLVLPRDVEDFDPGWIRGNNNLEELVLPGRLEKINSNVCEIPKLKRLTIGPSVNEIYPGAFMKSHLESFSIDPRNENLDTDGIAIFSKGWETMLALVIHSEKYSVPKGCREIGRKAFSCFEDLKSVELPNTVEKIDEYAFSGTSIESIHIPSSVRSIEERAFSNCRNLSEVVIDPGLEHIGPQAFSNTAIKSLEVPPTIKMLDKHIADGTDVTFSGENPTFTIAEGPCELEIDKEGVLYRNEDIGPVLIEVMNSDLSEYTVREGTKAIGEGAFDHHSNIQSITLPEGLEVVREGAFRNCLKLTHVDVPDSLKSIEDNAFVDTSLESIRIPAALEHLGSLALVTHGAHHGKEEPSLKSIEVDEGNERFRMESGMLIETKDENNAHVVLYVGPDDVVNIPYDVTVIDSFAFNGTRLLHELYLSDGIRYLGMRAFGVESLLHHIHIRTTEPIEGHSEFDFYFPKNGEGSRRASLALNGQSIDVSQIMGMYDNTILSWGNNYQQALLIIDRLKDPVLMTEANEKMYRDMLEDKAVRTCVTLARNDDREAIDSMVELGYLNKNNIMEVIDKVGELKDAATTNHLLEIQRKYFGRRSRSDFDL